MNRRDSRRLPAFAALAAAASLLLTGCFSGGQAPAEGTGESGDARISIAMLQPPRSGLSPFSDDAFKLSRWSTAETLIDLDEVGDPLPKLVSAWEQLDELTWQFTLREDVTFHDGSALTAATAVNTLTKAMAAAPKPRILDGVELDVAEVDEYTFTVKTAEADPLLPNRLSSPQLAVLSEAAYLEDGTVSPLGTGSGPFELVDINGTSTATLDRYDGYWGDVALLAGIDVAYVPDGTARGAALRTGEAHVVEAIPVSQAPLLEQELVHEVAMPRTNTLYLNNATGVFADQSMRAAAREAIDAERIVETVYEGTADVAAGLLGPALPWAAEERQDVSSSVAAGTPGGQTVKLGTFTDRAELPEVAVLVEQQLEAAGFVVEQDVREYANIETDMLDGAFDIVILSRATVLDSGDPAAYMFSDFACEGSFNISQVCDPAIDAAIATASATPTGEERRQTIMAAEAAVLNADIVIPLLHERVVQGEAAGVSGAERDPRERLLITNKTVIE